MPSTYLAVLKTVEKDVPDVIGDFRGRDTNTAEADSGFEIDSVSQFIETQDKAKRVRITAAALREKQWAS